VCTSARSCREHHNTGESGRKRRDERLCNHFTSFFGHVINSIEVGLLFFLSCFCNFFNALEYASQPEFFFSSFAILKVWRDFQKQKKT
jgi:hypothetical protein